MTESFPGDLPYADLHTPDGLKRLLAAFIHEVEQQDADLAAEYREYLNNPDTDESEAVVSERLIRLAPLLSSFITGLFGTDKERQHKKQRICAEVDTIFAFRQWFIKQKPDPAIETTADKDALQKQVTCLLQFMADGNETKLPADADREFLLCQLSIRLLAIKDSPEETPPSADIGKQPATDRPAMSDNWFPDLRNHLKCNPALFAAELIAGTDSQCALALIERIYLWCRLAKMNNEPEVSEWVCLKSAQKTDAKALVRHDIGADGRWHAIDADRRQRSGFSLTDRRFGRRRSLYEVDHCIYCHDRGTDSCTRGMRNRRDNTFKRNSLGNTVTGCPLGQRISEAHLLKRRGDDIGALAMIMIDNPMCPGTGHRICNDCMKGCIYQKTEPVNIPQIETHILTEVLFMPWGFEIYSLLTRWNPLNARRPHALPYNGKNILVVGMGPAGYTLSHYLLNEGFGVVGIDALKIEPLPEDLIGSHRKAPRALRDFAEIYEDLDKRVVAGFGGVAEYGITSRWDKNFLTAIRLTISRRSTFRCYGAVRFGGTLTIDDAWQLGFDHIAMATGAGKPSIIGMRRNLIRGIRKASDFLMALQLGGAARQDSLTNLQIRLPIGVIGGGLTGVDTATEALAYYPVQVEKTRRRWESMCAWQSEKKLRAELDEEEQEILDEFLAHASAIEQEKKQAAAEGRAPDITRLLLQWGGAAVFYRKNIEDSPAYRLNHEELQAALGEGIEMIGRLNPLEAVSDRWGALSSIRFERMVPQDDGQWHQGDEYELPMRSLFIAAGTSPNTIYEQEYPYTFRMDQNAFQRYEPEWDQDDNISALHPINDPPSLKRSPPATFTSYHQHGRYITFYGDTHPTYAGSVVKAMASARDGYPYIARLFAQDISRLSPDAQPDRDNALAALFQQLDKQLTATVSEIRHLAPNIIEVIAAAPMQAEKFKPGQFYRVQNFSHDAPVSKNTRLATEGLALTGAGIDKSRGLISLITLEMGGSSRLCRTWKPGQPLVVMGVTGQPTEIYSDSTVLLAGGGLGNAVLLSIGSALRQANNRVLYFSGYRKRDDVCKQDELEAAADIVVWAVDKGNAPITPRRPQDKSYVGNIVEAMVSYSQGEMGDADIPMNSVDHIIAIGSDRMMAAVKQARHDVLRPFLKKEHTAIGSINSPMQCMMKGVCAQCLCRHIHPETGEEYFVYSCYNQDQELDRVDFDNLHERLRQNSLQEKITKFWVDYLNE